MDILREHSGHRENQARPFAHKNENRRKLARAAQIAVVGTIAAVGAYEALSGIGNFLRGEAKEPNGFMNGKVEIIMSDNLHVRTSPEVHNVRDGQEDNTVTWEELREIKNKDGTWVNIEGGKAIFIEMPAVYKGDELSPTNDWITFDAKEKDGTEERLYVNADPNRTGQYVKRVEPGSVYMLGGDSGADWTGTVTVEK